MLVLKKIRHMRTQNKITAPFINNTHKTDTKLKCNSLHQKYADINENKYTSEWNADLLVNSNKTFITLLMLLYYQY